MSTSSLPEVWLRGAVEGYAAELQPVVHALMQALEDVEATLAPLAVDEIWATPGGAASVGFHARHLAGALDMARAYRELDAPSSEDGLPVDAGSAAVHPPLSGHAPLDVDPRPS